jgi:DNA-binding XRE family transcriptional regulator
MTHSYSALDANPLNDKIDQLLQAGALTGVEIARQLGVREKRVSARRQALGLGSSSRRHAGRAAASANEALLKIDQLSPPSRSELDAALARELRHSARLDALALAALGYTADALAAHAARSGAEASLEAVARTLGSPRAGRLSQAVREAGKSIVGLSGEASATRVHLACSACAPSGGCGHAPHVTAMLAAHKKGQSSACMREAVAARAESMRKDGDEARRILEALAYWEAAPGFDYRGYNKSVRVRCPEGHIEQVVYGKAIAGQRCRQCGGHFGQRILLHTLKAMFGGEWIEEDRATFGFEIDCWCPAAAHGHSGPVAAAYDGIQHAGFDIYGAGPEKMAALLARDDARARTLADRGIPFVRMPDITHLLDHLEPMRQAAVFAAIEDAVLAAGLPIPPYRRFDIRSLATRRIIELRSAAERLGVDLLSRHWPGPEGRVHWHCPAHNRSGSGRARLFLQRATCCDAAPRRSREASVERHRRAAEAAGLSIVKVGRHGQRSSTWRCATGHVFAKSRSALEFQIEQKEEVCPWCALAARHHPGSIQALRAMRSWTAIDLARQAGVSRNAVVAAERDGECTAEQLRLIAKALETEPSAINLRRRCDGAQLSLFTWTA